MKHTPGEWIAHTQGADAWVECPDGRKFIVGDIIYHKENISNARLIAAAPELLAACKLARKNRLRARTMLYILDKAIAKAERDRDD